MKFPNTTSITLVITFCFAFYSIVGCSSSSTSTKYLDQYDALPYKERVQLPLSKDAAYKAGITALEKRGYRLTLSDPQTGIANLELHTFSKLPEEEKQEAAEHPGPSAGTIILIALSIILVVGIIILLTSSSDDSKDKEKDDDKSKSETKGTSRGRGGAPTKNNVNTEHHDSRHDNINYDNIHHEHHGYYGPFLYDVVDALSAPAPSPNYLYNVTLHTTALTDSTTEVSLTCERNDYYGIEFRNSRRLANKYLNYSIFDGMTKEAAGIRR